MEMPTLAVPEAVTVRPEMMAEGAQEDTAQNRLAGRAPGTAQEARQDDGHGYEEGRQALDGLEGEDEDLTQDGCESILHIEGDAGGRLVGVDRQNEHGGRANGGQDKIE